MFFLVLLFGLCLRSVPYLPSTKLSYYKIYSNAREKMKKVIIPFLLGAFFYRFVAAAMDLENLEAPTVGMMTPYSALFVFAV